MSEVLFFYFYTNWHTVQSINTVRSNKCKLRENIKLYKVKKSIICKLIAQHTLGLGTMS